jgi:predicted nucleic acid-binding protein
VDAAFGSDPGRALAVIDGGTVVPDVVFVEAFGVARRQLLGGLLDRIDFWAGTVLVERFPLVVHPTRLLLPRMAELGQSVGAYDAAFVALAEALDVPLLTLDERLSRAHGPRCEIRVLG